MTLNCKPTGWWRRRWCWEQDFESCSAIKLSSLWRQENKTGSAADSAGWFYIHVYFMLINIKNRELGNLDSWNDGTMEMAADVKSGTQNTTRFSRTLLPLDCDGEKENI